MAQLPITNGFYKSSVLPLSNQECINYFPFNADQPSLSEQILHGTPGINLLAETTGTGRQNNRGSHVKNDIPYFVNGSKLYSLTRTIDALGVETFTTNELGDVPEEVITEETRVSMADNGTQLMILVPGYKGYIYNENAVPAFEEITDSDFSANGNPQQLIFIDGYFVCTTDTKKWIVSSLNDGTAWSALDFGTAESDPDNIVAPAVIKNQMYILGSETTEGFQNVGGYGFPFQRNNVYLSTGCSAPFSVVSSRSTFFMIGAGNLETPAVWEFSGSDFVKISSNAIDYLLSQLTPEELADVWGFSYGDSGSYFLGWTLPDTTIVFELSTSKWHERKSKVSDEQTRWRANSLVSAYNRIIVGDFVSGKIGELDLDLYQEYGESVIRQFSIQPFSNNGAPVFIPMIEVTMESGSGNTDCPEPVISMQTSKDGKTWNYERIRKIGKKGEYNKRIIFRKNGRFPRFACLRFRMSDPVKPHIIKLEAT